MSDASKPFIDVSELVRDYLSLGYDRAEAVQKAAKEYRSRRTTGGKNAVARAKKRESNEPEKQFFYDLRRSTKDAG